METFENHAERLVFESLVFLVYASGGIFFSFVYGTYLATLNGASLAPLVVPGLAVFYGFSALMYNRARAFSPGAEQRRSLYAAERALQATLLYVCSIALAAALTAVYVLNQLTPQSLSAEPPLTRLIVFVTPIMLMGWAWTSFFFAFKTMAQRALRWQRPRKVLRRVRGYLTHHPSRLVEAVAELKQ